MATEAEAGYLEVGFLLLILQRLGEGEALVGR
jgi:hypothetical protein